MVCTPEQGRKFCAGTQKMTAQSLGSHAINRVVCSLRQAHLLHESYRPYTCFIVTRDEI